MDLDDFRNWLETRDAELGEKLRDPALLELFRIVTEQEREQIATALNLIDEFLAK